MEAYQDGPCHDLFDPLVFDRVQAIDPGGSDEFRQATAELPKGDWICWGIPFTVGAPVLLGDKSIELSLAPVSPRWLVFLHTAEAVPPAPDEDGFHRPMRGEGNLNQIAAVYRILFDDGSRVEVPIRLRHHLGHHRRRWGENSFESVPFRKPRSVRPHHEQITHNWGQSQTRVDSADSGNYVSWVWAWENTISGRNITGLELLPGCRRIALLAITSGEVETHPTRWNSRRTAVLDLSQFPDTSRDFSEELDDNGRNAAISLDLGQVISARRRLEYPTKNWTTGYNNMPPTVSGTQVLVDYTAHPEARFHLSGDVTVGITDQEKDQPLTFLDSRRMAIRLRVVDKRNGMLVPVKLHVHGDEGEYHAPVDRHRIPNAAWFEDYSVDFVHQMASDDRIYGPHFCTYISGETTLSVPPGRLYIEVSKGYEVRPQRIVREVGETTDEITIELDRVLNWREKGWVSADTHVHFLSPVSSLLEGAAEGVNVVNLLASQWGELMTNVGDFDGKTTWGAKESGGDGEYLVRVGTENRQHVLGHISLLGYEGGIIAPMTTGGPDESALGDPIGALLSEWAISCRKQQGVVVIPHFPNPRAENAAVIVEGLADGVEMTSWGNIYGGLDPYSLSDWYRYLNCGYRVAAVGGTDKMSASTPVGAVRTYARIDGDFDYDSWKEAVRRGETFVTYGPLLSMMVEGKPIGCEISLPSSGGTVSIEWTAESCTVPMTSVELVVNGRVREVTTLEKDRRSEASGTWTFDVRKSSWCALLLRGAIEDRPEIIAAHTSSVGLLLEDSPLYVEEDALTILEQIEGALAYVETVGTCADTARYREIRMNLESAHRKLHNRMHQMGYFHEHSAVRDHHTNH